MQAQREEACQRQALGGRLGGTRDDDDVHSGGMFPVVLLASQGEEVPLCPRCSLPVGEFAYQGREGKQACVHTECMAQVMSQEAQREEDARVKR